MSKTKRQKPGGRPREIVDGYRAMHLMPRSWVPFWDNLIARGAGVSEADLVRQACMKVYPDLPDPHTPEFKEKLAQLRKGVQDGSE